MKRVAMMFAIAFVLTLSALAPAYAGAVGGSRYGQYSIRPSGTHTFQIAFRGGEYAKVVVDGDGSTDLDVYIYDRWGRRVAFDDDYLDYCYTEWYVGRTAVYTIKVVNRGGYFNYYELATN
ncbi:MAG: hypothetical protein L0229_05260 [Blastocatellia bacterium]|nr:hypothetical protein [Blastocatellia bacterium]